MVHGNTVFRNPGNLGILDINPVTIFEDANFGGRSKALAVGGYRFFTPDDFNDVVSSIRVPAGLCAVLYEHADDGGGYGISVDLLEDCPDLSVYGFNDKVSYITVFSTAGPITEVRDHRGGTTTTRTEIASGFVYARNRTVNGQFVPGHWERQRASGAGPDNSPPAIVSPPYPAHMPTAPTVTQSDGAQTVITFLGPQDVADGLTWGYAASDTMGVIGSDYRGPEEIGTAAFERASGTWYIPDSINFWYPQKRNDVNDHRTIQYYKRTLAGKLQEAHSANIGGTYEDYDVNIDVIPNEKYRYLVTAGHPREYTDIMSAEWTLSRHEHGQASCDDPQSVAEASVVEAEINVDSDHNSGTAKRLVDLVSTRAAHNGSPAKDICIYGPWIYDKGHCCHSEIHPAEQIWWRDDISGTQKQYTFCLFCDASKRFWWRDQMDDGTKLKPWGAPPIRGIFAIAFEAELGKPAVTFEVSDIDSYNVVPVPNANQTYSLVYQSNVLVTFIPHNDAFKVSFEKVGLTPDNKVRGFLVLETTVGTVTQKATQIVIPAANPQPNHIVPPVVFDIPVGTDVNIVDQRIERQAFEKREGRYMFTVTQTNPHVTVDRGSFWHSTVVSHGFNRVIPTS